jgi:serine/threonine protein kinase
MGYVVEQCEASMATLASSLTRTEKVGYALTTAKALSVLHQNNLIHGSIKPENLLLTANKELRISDFGMNETKRVASLAARLVKDPHYTAPETIGVPCKKWSWPVDSYAFGGVLLFLFAEQVPFSGLDAARVIKKQLEGRFPAELDIIKHSTKKWAPKMAALIAQCLDYDSAKRPSMTEIIASLSSIFKCMLLLFALLDSVSLLLSLVLFADSVIEQEAKELRVENQQLRAQGFFVLIIVVVFWCRVHSLPLF